LSATAVPDVVRAQILAIKPEAAQVRFADSSSLVETGILDSLAVYSLVASLEARYRIEIVDEELRWENFASVDAITRLIEAKLSRAEAS
jgi:acyl carrier protein